MKPTSARMLAALECATLDLREMAVSVQEANRRLDQLAGALDRAERGHGSYHRS